MTFLAPIPMLAAAAATVPVLIAFYLLRLRRRQLVVSSVQFWEASSRDLQVNVPLRFLRASWLLFLHLLILALLLIAFGRPAIRTDDLPAQRVVLLIDASASMSAGDVEPSRLEAAKARARETVGVLARSDAEAVVVSFARSATALSGWTRNPRVLRRAIDSVEATDQPGDLAPALRLVEALVQTDADEESGGAPAEVVLFSDGSFAGESAVLAGAETRFERVGGDDDPDNIGIASIAASRDHDDPARVRVFVRLVSNRAKETTAPLLLTLDGGTAQRTSVAVSPRGDDGAPGEGLHTFEVETPEAGVVVVSVERRDDLASDDRAGVVLRRVTRPAVLYVAPEEASFDRISTGIVLLTLDELRARRLTRVTAARYAQLAPEDIAAFDLVVFDGVTPGAVPPIATLSLGGALPLEGMSYAEAPERREPILAWERDDPLLRGVSLDSVVVARALPIAVDRAGVDVVAELRNGPAILRVRDGTRTHVVTSFELEQSNWLDAGLPIFVANAVEQLTGSGGTAGDSFTTDEPIEVEAASDRVRLLTPGRDVVAEGTAREGRASLGVAARAGVYTLEGAANPAVAVNLLDAHESMLDAPGSVRVAGREVGASSGAGSRPREIWHWFVIAAAALLAVEWFVYAWRSRI